MEITREYLTSLQSFETEEAYRASPSLNYSTLKDIPNGPWCLINDKVFAPGKAFEVGDYVDKYFTNRDLLEELYELSKPKIELPESLMNLYGWMASKNMYEPTIEECIVECREAGLYASVKDDEKLKSRFTDDFFNKLKEIPLSTGKIQITTDQYAQAISSIDNIQNNEVASRLIAEGEGEFLIPQFKYEFELPVNGHMVKFRIMLDWLKFDTINKKIIGIDLKTGAKPSHLFHEQLFEYRYDLQGILYYYGIMALRKAYFPDWTVCTPEDFKFLYTPKRPNRQPLIIELTERFIRQHEYSYYYKGVKVDGLAKLIEDADWYIENQVFDKHRIIAQNNNTVTIDKLL